MIDSFFLYSNLLYVDADIHIEKRELEDGRKVESISFIQQKVNRPSVPKPKSNESESEQHEE